MDNALSMRLARARHDHSLDNDLDTGSDDASSIAEDKKGSTDADSIDGAIVRRSKLLDLPQELFDGITSYLGPAHIAVLALVNRELFARFLCVQCGPGPSLLATPDSDDAPDISQSWKVLGDYVKASDTPRSRVRGSLLSILDTDVLDLVYCYKCKTMHDPFITFRDRAYSPHKSMKCVDYSHDHHLPPRATRKMLRTITKRRKRDEPYHHLMQQVNHTTTTYKNGILVQDSARIRFRGDSLLLRRRQFVSPVCKTPLALWSFRNQLVNPAAMARNPTTNPKVVRICNHLVWIDQYQAMLQNLIEPLCRTSPAPAGHLHTPACFSQEPFHVSVEGGGEEATVPQHIIGWRFWELETGVACDPPASPLGDVRGCEKCTTDFSMDVVKLPEPFTWGFVLTTWLDLGQKDFCSKWNSHRHLTPPRPYDRTGLKSKHGSICENFESTKATAEDPSAGARTKYRPKISDLDRERMTNYGWGERASQGKGKYVQWSIGCGVDPTTGWIMDPDPLESDDE